MDPPVNSRRSRGGRRAVVVVLLFFVALVVLAILALPFLSIRTGGETARRELTAAFDALSQGDLPAAQAHVAGAREGADSASAAANGFRADVVGAVPVVGGAVDDLRQIVVALDEVVSIGELGVEVYPQLLGDQATLFQGGTVDLSALASVTGVADEVGGHLTRARTALDAVTADTPLVGGLLGDARDAALDQVVPLQSTVARYQPVLDVLPSLLGTEGPRDYLVAVMNPAELRFSGGATLSLAPLSFDQGQLTFGDSGNTFDLTDANEDIAWEPVPGNPWHLQPTDPLPLVNSTFSPNWTTSGEELLRAWESTTGDSYDALIAIDLGAIASLFTITGPVQVPKYGALTAANFVETLAGSYDEYPEFEQRRELNASIIPVLRAKLFDGGKFAQKAQALLSAADERRFVMYFRDPAAQAAIGELGITGDLSATSQDYLGFFTQNTTASKVDYYQRRSIESDVVLSADGSAQVTTTVTLGNVTPPFSRPNTDPQRGYFTRWSKPFFGLYLPMGAELATAELDGAPLAVTARSERDRPLVTSEITMEPETTRVLRFVYTVPQAAIAGPGTLAYALDVDPQATVNAADLAVTLRLPAGYRVEDLPPEWTSIDGGLLYESELGPGARLRLTATSS